MTEYNIQTEVLHGHGEVIDLPALLDSIDHPWWNRTLTQVNDSVVRVGCFHGEFHWHKHDNDDEFFFVLEGLFIIDFEGHSVTLSKHQGITVSKGVMHRPRSPETAVVMMVETSAIVPTGD